MLIKWKRGDWKKLTASFGTIEFECKCGSCTDQMIDQDLVRKLQDIRDEIGMPVVITSAYRCKDHQANIRGSGVETAVGVSQHELGLAADIRLVPGLEEAVFKRFKAIGSARTFLHVDLRADKMRTWIYK